VTSIIIVVTNFNTYFYFIANNDILVPKLEVVVSYSPRAQQPHNRFNLIVSCVRIHINFVNEICSFLFVASCREFINHPNCRRKVILNYFSLRCTHAIFTRDLAMFANENCLFSIKYTNSRKWICILLLLSLIKMKYLGVIN
jgi:hypothetical protein